MSSIQPLRGAVQLVLKLVAEKKGDAIGTALDSIAGWGVCDFAAALAKQIDEAGVSSDFVVDAGDAPKGPDVRFYELNVKPSVAYLKAHGDETESVLELARVNKNKLICRVCPAIDALRGVKEESKRSSCKM